VSVTPVPISSQSFSPLRPQ